MFDLRSRDLMVKIVLGVVLGMVSLGMLLYLVPMPTTPLDAGTDGLADIGGQRISIGDVQRQLDLVSQRQQIPQQLRGFYAQQIFDQMVFDRLLQLEAPKLGISITDQDVADEIRQMLPNAFPNGKWVGADLYSQIVQQQMGLSVEDFEQELRQGMLEQKFRQLVTAGVTVTPAEVRDEFRRRNEKVKLDYVVVDPSALAAKIQPADADLQAWYNAHKAEYQVPEQRSARYLLLDVNLLKQNTKISDADLLSYYNQHIDTYKVPDRVHAEHILFMTVGKTDAEIAEIQKQAEQVLAKVQHGGDFAKLAKQYSQDPGSKDKGGDLGWIVHGQTVPEFEKEAFTLPVGGVSGLVKTQYGFHIIKILGKETAHTKAFQEVRDQILQGMLADRVQQELDQVGDQMSDIVRRSNRQSLEAVEAALGPELKPDLVLGETPLVSVTQSIPDFGNSSDARDAVFGQTIGQLSLPFRIERGYAIVSVDKIVPGHQGTFAEVRGRVQADFVKQKAAEEARIDAAELASKVRQGQKLDDAAKALGLEVKTADFSRTGNVPGVGTATQLGAAFISPVGQVNGPLQLGTNWVVYDVAAHEMPAESDFASQRQSIQQELLTTRQDAAFEAFRRSLEDEMKREGKLQISAQNLKRLTNANNQQG
jgi:peptidyl-prolyl cis-trans isomerase D